jgi:hypothetical protein
MYVNGNELACSGTASSASYEGNLLLLPATTDHTVPPGFEGLEINPSVSSFAGMGGTLSGSGTAATFTGGTLNFTGLFTANAGTIPTTTPTCVSSGGTIGTINQVTSGFELVFQQYDASANHRITVFVTIALFKAQNVSNVFTPSNLDGISWYLYSTSSTAVVLGLNIPITFFTTGSVPGTGSAFISGLQINPSSSTTAVSGNTIPLHVPVSLDVANLLPIIEYAFQNAPAGNSSDYPPNNTSLLPSNFTWPTQSSVGSWTFVGMNVGTGFWGQIALNETFEGFFDPQTN